MRRLVLSCLLIAVLAAPVVANTVARFSDVDGHRHAEAIERLREKGIVEGYPDGRFQPDRPLSRDGWLELADRLWTQELQGLTRGEAAGKLVLLLPPTTTTTTTAPTTTTTTRPGGFVSAIGWRPTECVPLPDFSPYPEANQDNEESRARLVAVALRERVCLYEERFERLDRRCPWPLGWPEWGEGPTGIKGWHYGWRFRVLDNSYGQPFWVRASGAQYGMREEGYSRWFSWGYYPNYIEHTTVDVIYEDGCRPGRLVRLETGDMLGASSSIPDYTMPNGQRPPGQG